MDEPDQNLQNNRLQQWYLSPKLRAGLAFIIYFALAVGEPYSNFMLGAVAGVILYPVAEFLVYMYIANSK